MSCFKGERVHTKGELRSFHCQHEAANSSAFDTDLSQYK